MKEIHGVGFMYVVIFSVWFVCQLFSNTLAVEEILDVRFQLGVLKGGIVVTDEYGSKYYIEFDRWLKKSEWGSE